MAESRYWSRLGHGLASTSTGLVIGHGQSRGTAETGARPEPDQGEVLARPRPLALALPVLLLIDRELILVLTRLVYSSRQH